MPQLFEHAPQFAGSLMVLVHRPLQVMKPEGQPAWHMPFAQAWPAPQVTPQPPQFAGSFVVATHWPLQVVCPH